MGESIASSSGLEVSVSFGRFENDSLSWEKWSSFSPNKYLEEVEKCSTPGSVAQKKAYFEAHYKKIAARKAELVLEQQMETNHLLGGRGSDNNQTCNYHTGDYTCGTDIEPGGGGIFNGHSSPPQGVEEVSNSIGAINNSTRVIEFGVSNGHGSPSPRGIEQDTTYSSCFMNYITRVESDIKSESFPQGVEQETDSISAVDGTDCDALNEDASIAVQSQGSVLDGRLAGEIDSIEDSLEVKKPEETVLFQEDTHLKGSQGVLELPPKLDEERESNSENKAATVKSGASIKSHKISPTKKEKNLAGVKKKLAPSLPKSPKIPAPPRLSKPTTTSTVISTSRSSTKKSNSSLLPRSNNSIGESKRVAPMSLHMSLSLGLANYDSTSLTTTRKSLIMEKMGDKDIVKRAFRTFQNNVNRLPSSSDERSSGTKQVLTKGMEQKLSTSLTPRKENDGTRKCAEKINAERDQSGTRQNFMSSGSSKRAGVDQKKAKASPSSFGLRSDERADKRREFLKKPEEKSSAKEAERAHLSSKSRDKNAEIKRLRQSLDFKATPLPRFYRGQGMSKTGLDKEGARKQNHGRPETHR